MTFRRSDWRFGDARRSDQLCRSHQRSQKHHQPVFEYQAIFKTQCTPRPRWKHNLRYCRKIPFQIRKLQEKGRVKKKKKVVCNNNNKKKTPSSICFVNIKPQNKNQNSSIEKELNVRWYWKSDTDWVEYPKNIAENLERAYMANQKTIQIDSERFVDLGVLQQKRIDNPIKIRPVKRVTIFPIQDTPKAAQPLIPNVIPPKSNQPQQPLSIKPSNQNNLITQSKAQLQSSTTTIHSSAQQPKQFSQNTKQTEKEISLSSKPSTHKPIYAKWFWKGKKKTNPLVSFKLRI